VTPWFAEPVLAAWFLWQDTALLSAAAIARVRDAYLPEYARLRFPEHPSREEVLDLFDRER
jgi:hypothetical protein